MTALFIRGSALMKAAAEEVRVYKKHEIGLIELFVSFPKPYGLAALRGLQESGWMAGARSRNRARNQAA